jgi:diadenylate cyclase
VACTWTASEMTLFGAAWNRFAPFDLRAALDILVIAALLYYLLKLFRGTRAAQMVMAIVLLVALYQLARWARLETVDWLLTTTLPYLAIALIVIFQPEIRRALARAGHTPKWWRLFSHHPPEVQDDLVMAAGSLAQNRTGALIVLERRTGLRTYVESGIPLDAILSYDLLLAIFRPESPMHDGAVIVREGRIAAAACFLPLSLNPLLAPPLGTRHRAAIGVTEESDAVAVVVSEENGRISLAVGGTLEANLSTTRLAERLTTLFVGLRPPVLLPSVPGSTRSTAHGGE